MHPITEAIAKIALGRQDKLIINNLDAPATTGAFVVWREYIRLCFQELGIEVEFSGKGLQERGVVIDLDAERMTALGLNADELRFGQTVVRTDHSLTHQSPTSQAVEDIIQTLAMLKL